MNILITGAAGSVGKNLTAALESIRDGKDRRFPDLSIEKLYLYDLTSPAEVRLIRREAFDSVVLVTIHEGRNRQVRRMFDRIGHQVVALRRVGFGPIALGDLPRGQWRKLTEAEIRRLKEL